MKKRKLKVLISMCLAFTLINTSAVLNIPANVVSAEAETVESSQDFDYIIDGNDNITIKKYTGSAVNIEVPSYINCNGYDHKVTAISRLAFKENTKIESIILPDTIEYIGDNAFEDDESLKSISIPDSVTSIGSEAFRGCSDLESIKLPKNLKSISHNEFVCCRKLSSINIPSSVTSIDVRAFDYCNSLTKINIEEENNTYKSVDGVVYSKDGKDLLLCPFAKTELHVEAGVTNIGEFACGPCNDLNKVNFPDTLKIISEYAFSGCSSLKEIKLPDSVLRIETFAFSGCEALDSVKLSNNLQNIGRDAFEGCIALQKIEIPDSVTDIERGCFSHCKSLQEVKLSNSISSVNGSLFYHCDSLKEIVIPESVTAIRRYAFDECDNLQNIIFPYRDSVSDLINKTGYYTIKLTNDTYHEVQLIKKGSKICTHKENCTYYINNEGRYTDDVIPAGDASYNFIKK